MTLPYLTAAWLAGIAIGREINVSWWLWLVFATLSLLGILLSRRNLRWRMAFGCSLLFMLGAARLHGALPRIDEHNVASYNDQGYVAVRGLIVEAPDRRDTQINLTIQAETITPPEGEQQAVNGLVLVQAPLVGDYHYGDRVVVEGELRTPPEYESFSYRDYLALQGVHSIMQYVQIDVIAESQGNPLRTAMLDFRAETHRIIKRLLPDPQASLLAGILLGIESGISPEVRDAFNAAGTTHIIAISGSNLAILAGLLLNMSRRVIKERWAVAVTIVGILAYTIFVGGDPAVVRAAIMVTLGLVATQLGRQTWGLTSLSFAALLMTAIHPLTLWDMSFQLSFMATLGLILYTEPLQIWLEKGLSRLFLANRARQIVALLSDAFIVTIAAQITTTPLMAYHFGRLSLFSLPANLLIIPLQTPLMVLGGISVLAALIIWPVGQMLAWGSWLFLSLTIWVAQLFARLPHASMEVNTLSPLSIWGIYGLMLGLTVLASGPEDVRTRRWTWLKQAFTTKAMAGVGMIVATLLMIATISLPDGRLHVSFIDVGPGVATLIETPSGRHILIDAGGSGRKLSAALGNELPFWKRQLDLLILTQPTSSHTSGLSTLLERYHFDAVLTNGMRGKSDQTDGLWSTLDAQGAQEATAQPGMVVKVGDGVTLTVLHTQTGLPTSDQDEPGEPIILMVGYADARFLLADNLTPEGEAILLRTAWMLDATVLQVPRSGHQSTSSEAFLAAASPQVSVLSIDTGNRSGLPDVEMLALLESMSGQVYRTDHSGTLYLITDGHRFWSRTSR